MELVPWKKENGWTASWSLENMQDEMERLFGFGLLSRPATFTSLLGGDWAPALDVSETENDVVVKADLPGVSKNDIQISVEGETLKECAAPEILGEMKQFTVENERTATVRATADASILTFYWHDLVVLSETVFSGEDQLAIQDVITKLAGRRMMEHRE